MCGIVGVFSFKSKGGKINGDTYDDILSALSVQRHRGPDDQGISVFSLEDKLSQSLDNSNLTLPEGRYDGIIGFNRLSIKDLSSLGHQPMTALDGQVILTFNGEIYNDRILRNELCSLGYKFKGRSDTEVVLNLYLELGFDAMIKKLNGMFAIVIVDLRDGNVYFARDRIGIKPLYYTIYNSKVVFASELKSIIEFRDFERKIDIEALNARLIFSRPSDKVMLSGVFMLDPGQIMRIDSCGNKSIYKFYQIDDYERIPFEKSKLESILEEADSILTDVTERQMLSDVKVGTQLSGGVDSSIVSYYANKKIENGLRDGISIIDETEKEEERYIDFAGHMLGIDVHKYAMDGDYYVENYIKSIWFNDAPVYSPYFVNHMRIAEMAKKHVTVTLSGEGADELAGGYNRFAAGIYQPFLASLQMSSNKLTSYPDFASYAVASDATNPRFTSNDWNYVNDLLSEQKRKFNVFTGSNFTKQVKFEMTYRLPEGLMRQDKMNMAYSIENRVPLLDNDFVDFVMRIPEEYLLRFRSVSPLALKTNPLEWAVGKYFLKELCAKKFGHDFAFRRKTIMVLDKRSMLKHKKFRDLFCETILPGMKLRGILNHNLIEKLFNEVATISESDFNILWRSMGIEVWCQLFIDKKEIVSA